MLGPADKDDRQSLFTTQGSGGQRHINTLEAMHCDRYFNRSICLALQEDNEKDQGLEGCVGVVMLDR